MGDRVGGNDVGAELGHFDGRIDGCVVGNGVGLILGRTDGNEVGVYGVGGAVGE